MQTLANQTTNDTQAKQHTPNPNTLRLIDDAVDAAKRAAHAIANPQAKEHLEYALALLTESWIAEDGQQARPAKEVIGNVATALELFDALEAYGKEGK